MGAKYIVNKRNGYEVAILMVFPFSFVFLQLYYDGLMPTDESRPILLPTEQAETQRSIRLLDLIKPYDTHKIGVLYVRKGQRREQDILSNTFGSLRYMQFLSVRLKIPVYTDINFMDFWQA